MSYLGQQLGQGQAERFIYTATGGETSVTTDDAGRGIAYTVGQVDVYLNGAKLINGSDFTATTGTSITGLTALTASDVLEVFALSIFQASDTVSAASGGTFNGNITINADLTVDTNTLFVDATNNRVGVGTSSPAQPLEIVNSTFAYNRTRSTNGAYTGFDVGQHQSGHAVLNLRDSNYMQFSTDDTERMRISSGGNVGIGTSSPASDAQLTISESDDPSLFFNRSGLGNYDAAIKVTSGSAITFLNGAESSTVSGLTERMRIDASGNLLVGKTSQNIASAGLEVLPVGTVQITRNNTSLVLNRLTTDGTLAEFRKDGVTVGSIGESAGLYIERASGAGWQFGVGNISPRKSGALADGQVDLGSTSYRYKDLYLSGGVYLGGTGAANLLDDYEEGTITITGGSYNFNGSGSVAFVSTQNELGYTKIGDMVSIQGRLVIDTVTGTPSGTYLYLTGALPFTPADLTDKAGEAAVNIGLYNTTIGTYQAAVGTINENSTQINIFLTTASGNQVSNMAGGTFYINATYRAA